MPTHHSDKISLECSLIFDKTLLRVWQSIPTSQRLGFHGCIHWRGLRYFFGANDGTFIVNYNVNIYHVLLQMIWNIQTSYLNIGSLLLTSDGNFVCVNDMYEHVRSYMELLSQNKWKHIHHLHATARARWVSVKFRYLKVADVIGMIMMMMKQMRPAEQSTSWLSVVASFNRKNCAPSADDNAISAR